MKQSVLAENKAIQRKGAELEQLWAKHRANVMPEYTVSFPDEPSSALVPKAPLPVSTGDLTLSARPVTSAGAALCSAAVTSAVSAGLPPFLSGVAYNLCIDSLPELQRLGITGAKNIKNYLVGKLKSSAGSLKAKFMAGNKISKPTRAPVQARRGNQPTLKATPTAPGPSYGRAVRAAPAAFSVRQQGTGRPRLSASAGGVRVRHSEMVASVISNSTTLTFQCDGYTLNPGKFSTFPWLSTLASNFDKYRVHSMKVHLVSNQPTSIGGKVGIGFDYDSTDPLPVDRNEFFSLTHHLECAPWDSITLNLPIDKNPRFVNSHTVTDAKLIDCGQVLIMSDQIVATSSNLGDIIVDYDIELLEPQQAIYTTMTARGANLSAWSGMTITGPVVATLIPTTSVTVVEFSLPQGYYCITGAVYDSASGAVTLAAAVHGGVGKEISALMNGAAIRNNFVKITSNDAKFRFVIGVVALSALEEVTFQFSRISAVVYQNASGVASATTVY